MPLEKPFLIMMDLVPLIEQSSPPLLLKPLSLSSPHPFLRSDSLLMPTSSGNVTLIIAVERRYPVGYTVK